MHFHDHEERKLHSPCLKCSGEWIQKMCYIYTMEYYSAIKNNEFRPGVVAQACNPSTQEAEAGGFQSSRPA